MLTTIGESGILSYSIFQDQTDNTTYKVKCDNDLIDYAMNNYENFIFYKIPKFGKFEA